MITKKTKDNRNYWFLVTGQIEATIKDKEGFTDFFVNTIFRAGSKDISMGSLTKIHELLAKECLRRYPETDKINDVKVYGISCLGFLTEKEFNNSKSDTLSVA